MAISLDFPKDYNKKINLFVKNGINISKTKALRYLYNTGKRAVDKAVREGNYEDRTGNLRSSIGFVVGLNGRVVRTYGFKTILSGSDGSKRGKEIAESLVLSTGYSLVIVAGAAYAGYVEAMENYTVLAGAELYLKIQISKLK